MNAAGRFLVITGLSWSVLSALDISAGKGTFDFQMDLKPVLRFDAALDVDIVSIKEPFFPIYDRFYLYGNIDIYRSRTLDGYASYADGAADFDPFGISMSDAADAAGVPQPATFEMRGLDLLVGLGYTLFRNAGGSVIGIGIGSGVSMPYMETKHMLRDAQTLQEYLEKTQTQITTYKIVPSLQGRWYLNRFVFFDGGIAYGIQKGKMTNDYINGDADFSGTVLHSDVSMHFLPFAGSKSFSGISFEAGYRYNEWNVDTMKVSVIDSRLSHDFAGEAGIGFTSSFWYIGAGWTF